MYILTLNLNSSLSNVHTVKIYENRASELAGGYIIVGKLVVFSVIMKTLIPCNNNALLIDFPKPLSESDYPVLIKNITHNTFETAYINDIGSLCVLKANQNDWLLISGSYLAR